MLSAYTDEFCKGYILLCLILWAFAGYAYRVNTQRPEDDPKKKDFHPAAVFLAPFTWPLFLFGMISLFILKAIFYGIFLLLLTVALVAIRKPFIFIWLDKIATMVGDKLLEANTMLIKVFLNPWTGNSQPA
ncbi:MAG: hypothetical protein HXY35_12875 [Chloroflexi bacterium]|nr:hypothetical protein [Chloroflexota bacterium]